MIMNNSSKVVKCRTVTFMDFIMGDSSSFVYFGKNTDINDARCTSFFESPDPKLKEIVCLEMVYLSIENALLIKPDGYGKYVR